VAACTPPQAQNAMTVITLTTSPARLRAFQTWILLLKIT
jgi:hypothetical protein